MKYQLAVMALCLGCLDAPAQTRAALTFPEAGAAPSADSLSQRLAGKKFMVNYADGTTFRIEFKPSGYYFVNAPGVNLSGEWKAEDGRLCTKRQGQSGCNDVRTTADGIYLKRDSGEIIQYLLQ